MLRVRVRVAQSFGYRVLRVQSLGIGLEVQDSKERCQMMRPAMASHAAGE